jgi:hypothetical protein
LEDRAATRDRSIRVIVPPCAAMIDWQMARPMPMPSSLVVKKLSKIGRDFRWMPGPLSRTEKGPAVRVQARVQVYPAPAAAKLLGLNGVE